MDYTPLQHPQDNVFKIQVGIRDLTIPKFPTRLQLTSAKKEMHTEALVCSIAYVSAMLLRNKRAQEFDSNFSKRCPVTPVSTP